MAQGVYKDKEKPQEVRKANIAAARSVADAIRTSLGPKGMDKMIQTSSGQVLITNDGHTILKHMAVMHPAAKILVDLSAAQDVEAGDGTTSVVVLAGALLGAAERLLARGLHPTIISDAFQRATERAVEIIKDMSDPIELSDRSALVRAAATSLNSKIVAQYSSLLPPMAVDAVLRVIEPSTAENVDLNNIKLVKSIGGTLEDTELIDGLILDTPAVKSAGGPTRIEKAKIGLVQFQLSPPKPDLDNQIVVNDYRQMDKILKEERQYLLNMCKKIKKAKCNVLFVQKSILRDAVNDLSLHFLAKLNILVVKDIERDDIEFIAKSTGCKPIADIDSFTEDKLGSADLVEEVSLSGGSRIVQVSGIKLPTAPSLVATAAAASSTPITVSILIRGANNMILDEAERSLHDALCVIRCLVKQKSMVAGGAAPEIEVARVLTQDAMKLAGTQAVCWQEFASALEVIPTTLAENAGLNSIDIVTDLRNRHNMGQVKAGVSVKKGVASDITEEHVIQPSLVTISAFQLASETVKTILRIDDIAIGR
ncbi:hypothetical protein CANCADRAFT_130 [Tortispora caseinolytica NRRL Y-17796]|uniref:T-complex protein 1 subunit delta n=1 Tax=Tortispora caseinolytica NRRL Y-17796 TaxID=767744 RepID=A0A1E4TII7_9ASCO|nr:hypothetical protein CANCADRAFT_130 [Tortispora caseinolytica NRRL Y-17796]